ncbi:RTC4-like domain-containing protein [Mycena floridula]|nr:RTC4-like domain-containing protein [Mycena floridula]
MKKSASNPTEAVDFLASSSLKPPEPRSSQPKKNKNVRSKSRRRDSMCSDDELDCFSSSQTSDKEAFVDEKGIHHEYHPDFRPDKRSDFLKSTRIKKNKSVNGGVQGDSSSSLPKTNNSLEKTSLLKEPLQTKSSNHSSSSRTHSQSSLARRTGESRSLKPPTAIATSPRRPTRSASTTFGSSQPEKRKKSQPSSSHVIDLDALHNSKAKKQSFPEMSSVARPSGKGKEKMGGGKGKASRSRPTTKKNPNRVMSSESDDSESDCEVIPAPRKPQPMPDLSPLSSPAVQRTIAAGFPVLSPLSSPANRGPSSFPFPSPLSSPSKGYDPDVMNISDDEPKRFESSSLATPRARPSRNKRSSDGQDGSDERRNKKGKSSREQGDYMFLDPDIDPKTLCPYCDNALPKNPTPCLKKMLASAREISSSHPRPTNPLGRKAPLAAFISVCQRHQFESHLLPEAEEKGWPQVIDWTQVEGRIKKMKRGLAELIQDHDGDEGGPRQRCIFWDEIIADVKKKGSNAASNIRNQFDTFEKTQPGYYGELGSVIILQTLYNLFPLDSLNPAHVQPLNPSEFMQRILVPEVALRLIMEDQNLSGSKGHRDAVKILRDSATYGVAMFPEDEGESGGDRKKNKGDMGVADKMVMDRARRRRKELDQEEEEAQQKALTSDAKPRPKPKQTKRPDQGIPSSQSAPALHPDKEKPWVIEIDSDSDAAPASSDASSKKADKRKAKTQTGISGSKSAIIYPRTPGSNLDEDGEKTPRAKPKDVESFPLLKARARQKDANGWSKSQREVSLSDEASGSESSVTRLAQQKKEFNWLLGSQ